MAVADGWRGRFLEDFEVGDVYRFALGRTVTEADNVWFTHLTLNTNQIHFNTELAKRSPFGRPLVNSAFTIALVLGMSVSDVSQNAVANLSMDEIRLPTPVFVGDTLYVESTLLSKRESRTRPYAGIISVFTRGLNQHGVTCVSFKRSIMVYKGNAEQVEDGFPEPLEPIEEAAPSQEQ